MALPVCGLFLCTCTDLPAPGEKQPVSVLCMPIAGHAQQEVYIFETQGLFAQNDSVPGFPRFPPDSWFTFSQYFSRGATVVLNTSGGLSYQLVERYDTTERHEPRGFYAPVDSMTLRPNDELNLVIHSGTGIITGQAIIPGDFRIIHPAAGDEFQYDLSRFAFILNARWTRSTNAAGYLAIVHWSDTFGPTESYTLLVTDTTLAAGIPVPFVHAEFSFEVIACDKHYIEHTRDGFSRTGLQGPAYGFCGAGLSRSVPFRVGYTPQPSSLE